MEDRVLIIRESLESIRKAIIIKIENGDQASVANELKWFDDLIFEIYNLRKINFSLFKDIIDPADRHKIIEYNDLSKIDWSKAVYRESKKPSQSKDERTRSYVVNAWQSEYDLLDSFLSFSIKIWEAAIRNDSFGTAKRALYVIGNIYRYVAFGEDDGNRFNYNSYFNFFLQSISYKIDSLLTIRTYTEENSSLIRFMMFQFHLDHFTNVIFPVGKFEVFSKGLFSHLKIAVDRNRPEFINDFVRALDGLSLKPYSNNPYADLSSLVQDRFEELRIEKPDLLKQIPMLGFWKQYYLFTTSEFEALANRIKSLEKQLITYVGSDELAKLVSEFVDQLTNHALARHKYRLLQGSLIKVLVYSIFRKQYQIADFALQFENPADADALWGNKDILPNDLRDIMMIIYNESQIQHELMFFFPDRHGSPKYIRILCVSLLYRYAAYKKDEHVIIRELESFIQINIDEWQEVHTLLLMAFEQLKQLSPRLYLLQEWPFEDQNRARYEHLNNLFNLIIEGIKDHKIQTSRSSYDTNQ